MRRTARRLAATALVVLVVSAVSAAGPESAPKIGFYQWLGAAQPDADSDLLGAARRKTVGIGAGLFRFYLGARYDYRRGFLAPDRFEGEAAGARTPAEILSLPRYRETLEDPALKTIVLTVYPSADYGAGPDDLSLLRPWGERERTVEYEQIVALCRKLYRDYADRDKTFILANNEADEKLMEALNYGGSAETAIDNLIERARTRQQAVEDVRDEFPGARARVLHAFEISVVNLRIARVRDRYRKSARGAGRSALADVVPHIRCDLISYSAYESANSPFETRNTDVDPQQTYVRLMRDLDIIRDRAQASISPLGRKLFGSGFVMIGELGFARDRFENLPTGGVLPRLYHALRAARDWGCPYAAIWQVFDAPRMGAEAWGFGAWDRERNAPLLRAPEKGCRSVEACLRLAISEGLEAWAEANGY